MANVKNFDVTGTMPFNADENETLKGFLAFLAGPVSGLRIEWTGSAGYVKNEHGGQTAMYSFHIVGHEAVSWAYWDNIKKAILEVGGTVTDESVVDPEDG